MTIVLRFRSDVSLAPTHHGLVLYCDGLEIERLLAGVATERLAILLLGGIDAAGVGAALQGLSGRADALLALDQLVEQGVILSLADGDDLVGGSSFEQEAHLAGWSGAVRMLTATRLDESVAGLQVLTGPTGPEIPRRSEAATHRRHLNELIEDTLPPDKRWLATWIQVNDNDARVVFRANGKHSAPHRRSDLVVPRSSLERWVPVIFRSGVAISDIVVLLSTSAASTPTEFVHQYLLGGLITRNIESAVQAAGLGYLAHYWADPQLTAAISGGEDATLIALIGIES